MFLHSWSEATLTLVWCNSDMLQNSSLSYFVEIFLNLCLAGILVCSFPFCLFWFYITVLLPQHGHAGLIEWCRRVACLWILWILGALQETSVLVCFFFSRFGEVQQWMYLFLDFPLLETFHYWFDLSICPCLVLFIRSFWFNLVRSHVFRNVLHSSRLSNLLAYSFQNNLEWDFTFPWYQL